MPSQDFNVTETPVDIVADLSLVNGTRYTCQNVSTTATLFVREATAIPSVQDRGFKVEAGGNFTLRPDGVAVWMWTDTGSCPVILDDAA